MMNCRQAAEEVLRRAGEPLHYAEIARRMIDEGLWQTKGVTPERTVNATITQDLKNNSASVFVGVQGGIYGLKEYSPARGGCPTPRSTSTGSRLSFTDAAEKVLQDAQNNEPMHYRTITERAIEEGVVETSGKTPEATMYSVIYQEIERQEARGERPRFVLYGKGLVGLTEWMSEGLAFQVERHNAEVRKELLGTLHAMPPDEFEATVAKLLVALGFADVEATSVSSDGGIDVRGVLVSGDVVRTKMAVQVKRWKRNVQAPVVQQVRGSLGAHEQGLIVTTSDFSKGACDEAERSDATPVGLMNGELMVALMVEHDIGVRKNPLNILEIDGFALDENDECCPDTIPSP